MVEGENIMEVMIDYRPRQALTAPPCPAIAVIIAFSADGSPASARRKSFYRHDFSIKNARGSSVVGRINALLARHRRLKK